MSIGFEGTHDLFDAEALPDAGHTSLYLVFIGKAPFSWMFYPQYS